VDRLTALIAIAHAQVRIEIIKRHPELLEATMPTPKLQSLTKAMAMLEHNLEADAEKLLTKVVAVGERGKAAFVKSHAKVDGIGSRVDEVEKYVAALEGSNGGDPLDDSSASSEASQPQGGEKLVVTAKDVGSAEQVLGASAEIPTLTQNGATQT
jgi:hypothetical protein